MPGWLTFAIVAGMAFYAGYGIGKQRGARG